MDAYFILQRALELGKAVNRLASAALTDDARGIDAAIGACDRALRATRAAAKAARQARTASAPTAPGAEPADDPELAPELAPEPVTQPTPQPVPEPVPEPAALTAIGERWQREAVVSLVSQGGSYPDAVKATGLSYHHVRRIAEFANIRSPRQR
jgi:hypothetical protein